MRIGGISGAAVGPRRAAPERSAPHSAEPESRALVPVAPAAPTERPLVLARRPAAPFLAHLIATRMQAPQTRERRRAEPEEAIAAYATLTALAAPRCIFGKLA
jgi:hypothetical protein